MTDEESRTTKRVHDMQQRNPRSSVHVPAGFKVSPGDFVMVGREGQRLNYIGEVCLICSGRKELDVRWLYRPEDTPLGRSIFNGLRELYTTSHFERVPIGAIQGLAKVVSLAIFEESDAYAGNIPLYFTRSFWSTRAGQLIPPPTQYCVCRGYYNPDRCMVMCDMCDEWFHIECIGLTSESARRHAFICSKCKERRRRRKK